MIDAAGQDHSTGQWVNNVPHEIRIRSGNDRLTLRPASIFSREIILIGDETNVSIRPVHGWTRRAVISGRWSSFETLVFAFWLTIILWWRANSGGG